LFRESDSAFGEDHNAPPRPQAADRLAHGALVHAGSVDGETADGAQEARHPRFAKHLRHGQKFDGTWHDCSEQGGIGKTDMVADDKETSIERNALASDDPGAKNKTKDDGEQSFSDTVVEDVEAKAHSI